MVPEIWSTTVFFYHFRPLYPTNNQKNHNFKKMKETPGEHHFKVMYHK